MRWKNIIRERMAWYGVTLVIVPANLAPNGNVIRLVQRQQHYALANQKRLTV
jgi:hypothetical protein